MMGRIRAVIRRRRTVVVRTGPAAGFRIAAAAASNDYSSGAIELPVQECLQTFLRQGDVFFDIGANVGFFSLVAAAATNRDCRIVAFEPRPGAARMLRRNLRCNRVDAAVWRVAVGDSDGDVDLMVGRHPGGATIARDQAERGSQAVRVPAITIDRAVEAGRLPRPDVVKIDVEGAEPAVLRGMSQTLREARPIVVLEVDAATEAEAQMRYDVVESLLADLGYACTRLERSYLDTGWYVIHACAAPSDRAGR
jgi:FkbM family methyltransferase